MRKTTISKNFHPISRSEYTQRSLERAFPSGGWVEDESLGRPPEEGKRAEREAVEGEPSLIGDGDRSSSPSPASITIAELGSTEPTPAVEGCPTPGEGSARPSSASITAEAVAGPSPQARERAEDQSLSNAEPSGPLAITIIGGTRYDQKKLLAAIPLDHRIIVGAGRGVESDLARLGGDEVTVVELELERFGKHARHVNVEHVLCTQPDSPVVLVGKGVRVDQAESWLKRANWKREVIRV